MKENLNAMDFKLEGNEFFKQNKYREAIDSYTKAIVSLNFELSINRNWTQHKVYFLQTEQIAMLS